MLFAVLLPLLPLSTACATASDGGGGWVPTRIDLDVVVMADDGRLAVEGRMELRLEGERSSGPALYLKGPAPGMDFVDVIGPDGCELALSTGLADLGLTEGVRVARLTRDEPYLKGAEIEVEFVVEGPGGLNQLVVDRDIAFASWVEHWFPGPIPEKESNGSGGRPLAAPGTTRLHLPAGWSAITEGRRVAREESAGGVIETWELDQSLARSFAAGPYTVGSQEVDGREVGVYLLSRSTEEAAVQARALADAIAAMERKLGPFPYPSYAIAEVPEGKSSFYGASQKGFLMATSSAFEYGANLPLFAHEAAHAWWGNLVGTRGEGSLLCSETLAQYGAVIAIEELEGAAAATEFLRFSRKGYSSRQCARGYFEMVRAGGDAPLAKLDDGPYHHDLSDAKGHWVFHMLRRRVGDERFFATLRGLIEAHAGQSMSVKDARAAFLAAAPDARLEVFFEQWLDRTGAPVLAAEWRRVSAGELELLVRQEQEGAPYDLELELELAFPAGSQRVSVPLRERETRVTLQLSRDPTDLVVDPDHQLLIWQEEYGQRP